MCQFKSAIVVKDEAAKGGFRLLMSPWTESHSELCTIYKLNDGIRLYFARVEFTPSSIEKAYLPEEYSLRLDEERAPEWWNNEIRDAVTDRMRDYIRSIIVSGDADLLVGGQFIIAPTASIQSAHSMVINVMCGGTLNAMWGGTLNAMCGGTLNDMCGGTLNAMWGGTLNDMWGGTLNAMCGGTLNAMWGGTLNDMRGGTLNAMWGGTLNDIKECFNGLIAKVGSPAKIVTDNRPKIVPEKADTLKKKKAKKGGAA